MQNSACIEMFEKYLVEDKKASAKGRKTEEACPGIGAADRRRHKRVEKESRKNNSPQGGALRAPCGYIIQSHFYTPSKIQVGKLLFFREPEFQLSTDSHAARNTGQRGGSRALSPPTHESFQRILRRSVEILPRLQAL